MSYIVDERTGTGLTLFIFQEERILNNHSAKFFAQSRSFQLGQSKNTDITLDDLRQLEEMKARTGRGARLPVQPPVITVQSQSQPKHYDWVSAPKPMRDAIVYFCGRCGLVGRPFRVALSNNVMRFTGEVSIQGSEKWKLVSFIVGGPQLYNVILEDGASKRVTIYVRLSELTAALPTSPASPPQRIFQSPQARCYPPPTAVPKAF